MPKIDHEYVPSQWRDETTYNRAKRANARFLETAAPFFAEQGWAYHSNELDPSPEARRLDLEQCIDGTLTKGNRTLGIAVRMLQIDDRGTLSVHWGEMSKWRHHWADHEGPDLIVLVYKGPRQTTIYVANADRVYAAADVMFKNNDTFRQKRDDTLCAAPDWRSCGAKRYVV